MAFHRHRHAGESATKNTEENSGQDRSSKRIEDVVVRKQEDSNCQEDDDGRKPDDNAPSDRLAHSGGRCDFAFSHDSMMPETQQGG